jgi:hypothetical protein
MRPMPRRWGAIPHEAGPDFNETNRILVMPPQQRQSSWPLELAGSQNRSGAAAFKAKTETAVSIHDRMPRLWPGSGKRIADCLRLVRWRLAFGE